MNGFGIGTMILLDLGKDVSIDQIVRQKTYFENVV